jgi:hypothetical protein
MRSKLSTGTLSLGLVTLAASLIVLGRPPQRAGAWCSLAAESAQKAGETSQTLLGGAYRFERGGWVYVHLEGSPREIGYQHGYLLATEILDAFQSVKLRDTHETRLGILPPGGA